MLIFMENIMRKTFLSLSLLSAFVTGSAVAGPAVPLDKATLSGNETITTREAALSW